MGLWAARSWRVADAKAKRDAIGIGSFNLLRTSAYLSLGGFEALRMQIVEDVTLARRVKEFGLRQRIAFAPGMVSLHWAAGAMGVVKGMTKNLFAVFAFRPAVLLGACVWFTVFCLGPFVGLGFSATRLPALVTLAAIVVLYWLVRRMGGIPVWTALAFPFSAVLFLVFNAALDGGGPERGGSYLAGDFLSAGGIAAECGEAAMNSLSDGPRPPYL